MLLILVLNRIARLLETTIGIKRGQIGIGLGIDQESGGRIRCVGILAKAGRQLQGDRIHSHLALDSTGVFSCFLKEETLRGIDLRGTPRGRSERAQNVLGGACLENQMLALTSSFVMPNPSLVQSGAAAGGSGGVLAMDVGGGLDLLLPREGA